MAIELYRNPDGSVGGLDAGEVMVAPTQAEFEDCCCGCIIIGADADQPNAVISVAEGGGCTEVVCDSAGVYALALYQGPPDFEVCRWEWAKGDGWVLVLLYQPANDWGCPGSFCATIEKGFGGSGFGRDTGSCPIGCAGGGLMTDVTVDIAVVDGILTGIFNLTGDAGGWCFGCTATVTLG